MGDNASFWKETTNGDEAPITTMETEMWYAHELSRRNTCYNIVFYLDIPLTIEPRRFEDVLRLAIDKIDALRTVFVRAEHGPRKWIRRREDFSLPYLDYSERDDPAAAAREWMSLDSSRSFDLSAGPLFRYALLKISDNRFYWYHAHHHIITDSIGVNLIEQYVAELYRGSFDNNEKGAPQIILPSHAIQEQMETYRQSSRRERDRRFWIEQLAGRPEAATISGRPPATPETVFQSDRKVPVSTIRALERIGADCGASLAAVFVAIAATYSARLTGARDLVLGIPVSGRTHARLRRAIGLVSNVIPLRLTIDPAAPFRELVKQSARRMRDALRHQQYPSGDLRSDLGLTPDQPEIYSTLVNFVTDVEDIRFGEKPCSRVNLSRLSVTDLLILIFVEDKSGGLRVEFSGHQKNYDAEVLDRHLLSFLSLIDGVVLDPNTSLGALPILPEEERRRLLSQGAPSGEAIARATLPALFEASVAAHPNAVAVECGDRFLTYAELNSRANRLAARLIEQGVGPESLVGLSVERSIAMIVGIMAILKAGGAYLPLEPDYPEARVRFMLEEARPSLVLAGSATALALPPGAARMSLDLPEDAGLSEEINPTDCVRRSPLTADNAAYVIYTSGSTGRPKGVVVTHSGMGAMAVAQANRLGVTSRSRVLQFASLNFDASVWEVTMALAQGATLVIAPSHALSGAELRALLVERAITHATLPPAVLATLEEGDDLRLECLVVAGEACAQPLAARWSSRRRMINAYGPTEATVCATMSAALSGGATPIGSPLAGTRVYILDAALEPVPVGVSGELYIAGVALARGYLNRPGLTAERFVADPHGAPGTRMYRTGDLGRWRSDGQLEFLGRADRQLKVRGFRIEPGEIEALLLGQPGIAQAAVVAREEVSGGAYLTAYLVRETEAAPEPARLRQALAQQLPNHMIPSAIVFLPALPLTPSGKLDRAALPAPFEPSDRPEEADRDRLTKTEQTVAEIWRGPLRMRVADRSANFFELGGNSLNALQVVAKIRDAFGLEIPLRRLFESPSLGALAEAIDSAIMDGAFASRMPPIDPSSGEGPAPLSLSQERMWLIHELNPANTAYNMAAVIRLRGRLNVQIFAKAFSHLRQRHEILRTRIRVVDGRPLQEVTPWTDEPLPLLDLSARHGGAEAAAMERAQGEIRRTFDLSKGPVIRAEILRLDAEVHILVVALHHIAGDHWSAGILMRELARLYNGALRGVEARLDRLPITYRDYSLWQRTLQPKAELERQLAYWRRQLADLPALELPTDHSRKGLQTLTGAIVQAPIPASLTLVLEKLGRRAGATLFMTMLSAFAALLHRVTGQSDIAIGVPVANRNASETEGVVGTFVNTLVVRVDVSNDPEFAALLQRVRATALDALANQDVSFETLVRLLAPKRDANRAPLVQVLFNVANAPMHEIELEGLEIEPVVLDRNGAQFELGVTIETQIFNKLTVEYNTDLFERSTVESLVQQYFAILEAAVANPQTRVRAMPMLPAEQKALLATWNATSAPYPRDRSFPQLFEDQVERSPTACAVAFDGARLTYSELNARANVVAHRLRALGAAPNVRVALFARRSLEMTVALIAIQKSGAAYVPLDPDFPAQRLSHMLTDSGAEILVTFGDGLADLPLPRGVRTLALDKPAQDIEAASASNPVGGATPEDLAYIIYTSGSTGLPKGVRVTHGALVNFLWSMRQRPGLKACEVMAAVTTISFDIAALELYLPLIVGARIQMISREDAIDGPALGKAMASHDVTVMQATPATWRMLTESGWSGGPRFRTFCGGETLPRDLADALLDRVGELWNLFGPTETTVWSTVERVQRGSGPVSIGRPIANTQVYILDDAKQMAPIGRIGEIHIAGDGVAAGYHDRAQLTAERFAPDSFSGRPGARMYRTGDLGRWGPDGKLYHLGRNDRQAKIRGYRIELEEIEAVLRAEPSVRDAVVAAREMQPGDQRLVAYVLYRDGRDLTSSQLRLNLGRVLPDYMVPSVVMPIDVLPLTPNGKVDRNALPDPYAAASSRPVSEEPPAPGMESLLADVWKTVLGVDRVLADSRFYDLGGHSLLALRVAQAVEQKTGQSIDARTLLFFTLRQVAADIEAGAARRKRRGRNR